jgi:hypothetical protein
MRLPRGRLVLSFVFHSCKFLFFVLFSFSGRGSHSQAYSLFLQVGQSRGSG